MNDMRGYGQNHDIPSRWSSANSISAAQFDAIKKAAAEDGVEFEITSFNPEQIGSPPLYIWLKDHILIAVDLLNAAKAGDSAGLAAAEGKWYDNADDIATFLSDANPNWPKDHLVKMLDQHLSLTKAEAVSRLTGNYTADIIAFDEIHRQSMTMADELADGIVKQFPEQFEVDRTAVARQN